MKKIIPFLAGACLSLNALGQGYWANMIAGASGDFPNIFGGVNALVSHEGTVYMAGELSESYTPNTNNIYAFNGTGFMLGTTTTCLNTGGMIWTLCADSQDNIYAAGSINASGPGYEVMKWNGVVWTPLGGDFPLKANGDIYSICSDATGYIYAAGNFRNSQAASGKRYVAKWNGNKWLELGGLNALGANALIRSVAADAAGNIYAAGHFTNVSGNCYVAKWDGSTWSELGGLDALAANAPIDAVYADAAGSIYAAGRFTNASGYYYVAKWNGSAWSEPGTGAGALNANNRIRALTSGPAGDIYAGGDFTNGGGGGYVAQWDGSAWTEVGAGPYALSATSSINTLCTDVQGRVYAAGEFWDSNLRRYAARYTGNFDVDSVQIKVQNNLPPQITTNGGKLQMASKVFPVMGNQNVTWSIAPAALATISATGKITAVANGEVWPKATSVENPALSDSMMVTLSGQIPTGIDELIKAGAFQLFPNPARDELTLELAQEYSSGHLTIYDARGSLVLTQGITERKTALNIRSFAAGVYTLHYRSGSHKLNTTFTKR